METRGRQQAIPKVTAYLEDVGRNGGNMNYSDHGLTTQTRYPHADAVHEWSCMDISHFHRAFVTSPDGTRIAFESIGSGTGVVVLSGSLAPPFRYRPFAQALARSHTVHVVDRRGRGASGPQGEAYSMDRECDDILAVLEKTDFRHLFGHSFGGLTALQTALRSNREQLDSVVVYDAAVGVDGSMPMGFLPSFTRSVERGHHARAIAELTRGLQIGRRLDRLPFGVTIAVSWLGLNTVWKAEREVLPTVPREGYEALRLDGPASAYESISTPVHFLVGQHSPTYFLKAATEITAKLPAARVTVMPGLDHRGPLARPRPVAKALFETLRATASGERQEP